MTPAARRTLTAAGLLLALLTPFVVPVPDDVERMRGLRGFGVLAHFLLPGLLTIALHRVGPLRGRPLAAALAAFLLAAGCEFLQVFVMRHPRLQDAGVDLAGAASAYGWLRCRAGAGRGFLAPPVLGLLLLAFLLRDLPGFILAERAAVERFPVLADFETRGQMALWGENVWGGGTVARRVIDGDGVLELSGEEDDAYPGVGAVGLPRDWSGHDVLTFRARRLEGDVRRLVLRLGDFASRRDSCYVDRSFVLGPDWTLYEVGLDELRDGLAERPFRLDDIDGVLLYLNGAPGRSRVQLDDFVLR